MLQSRWLKGTVEKAKNLPYILAHFLIVGHQQVVSKDRRSVFVKVSSADNGVVTISPMFATSDMDQLAVHLETLHSKLNVYPSIAILPRPLDVCFLIKSRLWLHDDVDFFPVASR